jgi:acetate kinase
MPTRSPPESARTPPGCSLCRLRRLEFLGVKLDPDLNERSMPDADIARPGSDVRVLVIAAREELVAAHAVRALLAAST